MADLPLLLQDKPTQGLVICLGVGDAARAAVRHLKSVDPQAEIEVVELQKAVVDAIPLLQPDHGETLSQPGVHVYVRDGRHHVLMSQKKYDLVIIDTTPPFFGSGAVNLYSRDFQELVRDHLTPTGIFMQWLPTFAFESDFWAVVRGSQQTFKYQQLWMVPELSGAVVMSSQSPIVFDPAQITARLHARHLDQSKPWLDLALLKRGWVDEDWVRQTTANAPIVTDDMPITEYPLANFLRNAPIIMRYTDLVPPDKACLK
jgi:spermidine synthase